MKASINRFILGSVLLTAATTACVNDDVTASGDKVAVQLSASTPVTRAANNSWGENDVIGISMLKAESSDVIAPYNNYNYVTANGSSNFTPATSSQVIYFPVDGSSVSFKAYYPYSSQLPANMVAPLNVKDQSSLPNLDFMTAEHLAGASKEDPNVKLHFYHRLAKVLIDLTTEDNSISLEGCKLSVKGLNTTAAYNLMDETLAVDASSTEDISVAIRSGKGEAIFLPREAGTGVTFLVTTANGGVYTATLKDDVPFKAGYKHTLHIKLRKTPVTVSATIEEWLEGPTTHSNVIRLVTGLKDSENIKEGDTLRLFLKDQTDYAAAATFTYNAAGKWVTTTPIYWDNIQADPAHFIGTTVIDTKLNDTQMDDILVSKEAEVGQYTGVNLELQHAGAKVIVELKSTNGSFSADELASATITFPGYKYTGTVNAKGEFVIGDGTKDIVAEKGIAIFPPQSIAKEGVIAVATIGGRTYEIKANEEGLDFGKGIAQKLIADMSKTNVEISTVIIEWTKDEHEFEDVRIGSADLDTNGDNLVNGDKLNLYTGTDGAGDTDRIQQGEHFTYNTTGGWKYSGNTPLYWEKMPTTGKMYASITRPAISADAANNQLPDYITATPILTDGGVSNTAINFKMEHRVAKVIVVLKSETYSLEELKDATVELPSYMTGATINKGVFVLGETKADIIVKNTENKNVSNAAYLQPQVIAANATVAKVTMSGRVYEAKKESKVVTYEAGKITTLIITLEKSGVNISTTVKEWDPKPEESFTEWYFAIGTSNAGGFKNDDKLGFHKLNTTNQVIESCEGTVDNNKISTTWYRDDFSKNDNLFAVFPVVHITDNADNFEFICDGKNVNELQTAKATIGDDTNIKFDFKHLLSKVTVNIFQGIGFEAEEFKISKVVMNNFKLEGTVSIATEIATPNNNTASFEPSEVAANASYKALVMPQTIAATADKKVTIITVTLNDKTYPAEITTNATFESGKNHIYNITLNKRGISISTTVAEWTSGTGGDITIQ